MGGFQGFELVHKHVELAVGNLGRVKNIVIVIVAVQLVAQPFYPF